MASPSLYFAENKTPKCDVTDGHHTGFNNEYSFLCDGFTQSWELRHHGSQVNAIIVVKESILFVGF